MWRLCEAFGGLPGDSCSDSNQAMGHSVGVTVPLEMQRNPRCVFSSDVPRVCRRRDLHMAEKSGLPKTGNLASRLT